MVPSPAELKRFSLFEKKSATLLQSDKQTTLKRFKECVIFPQTRQVLL
jgi:hypothetical protein